MIPVCQNLPTSISGKSMDSCSINSFSDLVIYARKLIVRQRLDEIVRNLALELNKKFFYSKLECIVLMNGAYQLVSDLSKWITVPCIINFQRVSRYENDIPTKEIKGLHIPLLSTDNRPVLVIDDVFDEGVTLVEVITFLKTHFPKRSIYSLVLLNKDKHRDVSYVPDFIGTTIKDVYVFGYGMDLSLQWRHLPEVWEVTSMKQ